MRGCRRRCCAARLHARPRAHSQARTSTSAGSRGGVRRYWGETCRGWRWAAAAGASVSGRQGGHPARLRVGVRVCARSGGLMFRSKGNRGRACPTAARASHTHRPRGNRQPNQARIGAVLLRAGPRTPAGRDAARPQSPRRPPPAAPALRCRRRGADGRAGPGRSGTRRGLWTELAAGQPALGAATLCGCTPE